MARDTVIADGMQAPAAKPSVSARAWGLLASAVLLMVLILAASWAADSRMTEQRWLPRWVAFLADRDPNIRTAVPFVLLAFLLAKGFSRCGFKRPLIGAMVVCLACVGVAEFGQAFLPGRTADVWDVLWGGAGCLMGMGAARIMRDGCASRDNSWRATGG